MSTAPTINVDPFVTTELDIRLDITTNQPATQVYTAYWLNTPRKLVHGGPSLTYDSFSAVAIEQEGYIDAINTPEWGVDQICKRFSRLHPFLNTHFFSSIVALKTDQREILSGVLRTSSLPYIEAAMYV